VANIPRTVETEALAGLVERVTFHNPDNGFCVLRVKARGQRELITMVGHAATISAGEFVQAPEDGVNKIISLVTDRIPNAFGLDPITDIQVLCPMNRGGLGARSLNIELQKALNAPGESRIERFGWTFCPGDKVMQVENDYDRDVYNGDVGIVRRIDLEEGELVVAFDGREVSYGFGELDELVLAYAATIHKSQGSEYPAVVIPLVTQHYVMLARNLLYTGVTRGKRLVVLVGQRKALAIAVRNHGSRRRWAKLRGHLAGIRNGR
jgi:exodeoxyribonuclease V alpha subunit